MNSEVWRGEEEEGGGGGEEEVAVMEMEMITERVSSGERRKGKETVLLRSS